MISQYIESKFSEKIILQTIDSESADYFGSDFTTSSHSIKYRKAKITPKKIGAFVALWKRDAYGKTIPYDSNDAFDIYIIEIEDEENKGCFVFPKDVLVKHHILSSDKEGKRGFRLYMPWNVVSSVQASKTQAWQLPFFINYKFLRSHLSNSTYF